MGTRGLLCFIINGKKRGFYNQFDSYESGLGAAIVLFILLLDEGEWAMMQERLEAMTWVKENDEIPAEMWSHLASLNLVATGPYQSPSKNWYTATMGAQTGVCLPHILSGDIPTLPDEPNFENDSVFCEYSYHVDFGAKTFKMADRSLDGKSVWTFEELRMADGYWYRQAMALAIIEVGAAWTDSVFQQMMGSMKDEPKRNEPEKEDKFARLKASFQDIIITGWSPDVDADRKFKAESERNDLLQRIDKFGWAHTSTTGKLPDDMACIAALGLSAGSFDTSQCDTEEARWRMMYRLAGMELETILEKSVLLSRLGVSHSHKRNWIPGTAEESWRNGQVPSGWNRTLAKMAADMSAM